MKTVIMLPPTALGLSAVGAMVNRVLGQNNQWSLFIDLQANVVEITQKRYLVEHPIVGREGGILQDLGSPSTPIMVKGKWIYENEPDVTIKSMIPFLSGGNVSWNWIRVASMQLIFRMKQPFIFASDVITTMVMPMLFRPQKVGGQPNVYNYVMIFKEWNPALTLLGISGGALGIVPALIGEDGGI